MFALKKLRDAPRAGQQAHVTNLKGEPRATRGPTPPKLRPRFAELETTVGVARYAPLNAIALLVGSQTGRRG